MKEEIGVIDMANGTKLPFRTFILDKKFHVQVHNGKDWVDMVVMSEGTA